MNPDRTEPPSDHGDRVVTAAAVRDMLASLQEAVVTADPEARRALLKGVIAQLQETLSRSARV